MSGQTVVARTVVVPHPPEDVFAAVMSPEIAPEIDPAVKVWRADRRPIGVGTRFKIRGSFQWMPIRATSVVRTWDPPHLGVFEAVRPTRPLRIVAAHRFEPDGAGTRYTWESTLHHRSVVGRAAARFLAPLLERTIEDQHRTLARWLDEHPGASTFVEL